MGKVRHRVTVCAGRFAALGVFAAAPLLAETVVTAAGERMTGALTALRGGRLTVQTSAGPKEFPIAELSAVEFGPQQGAPVMAQSGRHVALAEDASSVGIGAAAIRDGRLSATTEFAGRISVPLRAIARIYRPGTHERASDLERKTDALRLKRGEQDTLLVESSATDPVPVSGILIGVSGGEVVLTYDGTEAPMPAETVKVILTAAPRATSNGPGPAVCSLQCSDGSVVSVSDVKVEGGVLRVRSPSLGELAVNRDRAVALRFRSEQIVALADLAPEVAQTPFFDESFPWRRNRAVHGESLRMAGKTYEQGIGVHARCELKYDLDGKYRDFSALAGIDDSVRVGAAKVAVLVDGKPAVSDLMLDRAASPLPIKIDLKGARRMTIFVDFAGSTFGNGARVDLCDATLRK